MRRPKWNVMGWDRWLDVIVRVITFNAFHASNVYSILPTYGIIVYVFVWLFWHGLGLVPHTDFCFLQPIVSHTETLLVTYRAKRTWPYQYVYCQMYEVVRSCCSRCFCCCSSTVNNTGNPSISMSCSEWYSTCDKGDLISPNNHIKEMRGEVKRVKIKNKHQQPNCHSKCQC